MIRTNPIFNIVCIGLLAYCVTANAADKPKHKRMPYPMLVCVGQESKTIGGKVWKVRVNFNAHKVYINQDTFNISHFRQFVDKSVVLYTEDFITTHNTQVYNAVISDSDRFYLHQYKAKPDKYLGGIELVCHNE